MNPAVDFISLHSLLETAQLPEGEELLLAVTRMRRRKISELELSKEGTVEVAGKACGRDEIDRLYATDWVRAIDPRYHTMVYQDQPLQRFLENGELPEKNFRYDPEVQDESFLAFLRPYFFQAFNKKLEATFTTNAEDIVAELDVLRLSFKRKWYDELGDLFGKVAFERLNFLKQYFEALKNEQQWSPGDLVFLMDLVDTFNALPERAYTQRLDFYHFLLEVYKYSERMHPEFCVVLTQQFQRLRLHVEDQKLVDRVNAAENFRKNPELAPLTANDAVGRRIAAILFPLLLILLVFGLRCC